MSRPLRVLMTADTVGGVFVYACELAQALGAFDVQITLATMGAPLSPAQTRALARLPNVDVAESKYALEWMPSPWLDVDAAGDWLLGIAARVRPDVVHVNGYAHAALPFAVPVVCVAHSCVVTWFRAVRGCEPGADWNEYRRRVRLGLDAAHAVVGPTGAILRDILGAYNLARGGHVIPNGRAPECWRPGDKESFVFAAGRLWDEAKGLSTLADCAPRLAWPVVVAGSLRGPGRTGGAPAGAESKFRALGELSSDELSAWMSRASIYALPARYEPFGLSVLEAALAGCALVLGDLPSLREVWEHTAVYVPVDDADALEHAIAALVRDPLRRGALAAAARVRALRYTPARMAASYRALYDDLRGAIVREVCA